MVRGRALGLHLFALAVVVLGFLALSDPGTGASSDEGAALVQARLLRDNGSWFYDYPLGWLDHARDASPFVRGNVGTEGVAPYAKHPLYPVLLLGVGAGTAGSLLLSGAGTVAAAAMAGCWLGGSRVTRLAPVLALWLTGVATPLLFDSGLILAHTLAAAAVGAAAVLAFQVADPGSDPVDPAGGLVRHGGSGIDAADGGDPGDRSLRGRIRGGGAFSKVGVSSAAVLAGAGGAMLLDRLLLRSDRRRFPTDAGEHRGRGALGSVGRASI